MPSYARRFVKAAARATIDLVALMALFPALAISYTSYRVTLIVAMYFLQELSMENFGTAVDLVKTIVAEVREEGLEGVVKRFSVVVNSISNAIVDMAKSFYQWVGLTAGFLRQETSQVFTLTA